MPVAPPTPATNPTAGQSASAAPRRARGFTLAESLIASVVLAASVIGIASTLSASYQQSSVRGNTANALALAQQLMEEIASKPMEVSGTNQLGWSAGFTNRANYDTIDDYNGYTDVSSSITTGSGSTIDLGDGGSYTRTVTVTSNARPSAITTGVAQDFMLVTVTVSMPHDQSVSISQLFTRVTMYR